MASAQWNAIGPDEWQILRKDFPESSLREWLAEIGMPVEQPYRGVQTKSLEELEASLRAMAEKYAADSGLRKLCRATVIAAKDRTRFASRNPKVDPEKRALKAEMVDWMLVWLDDPEMFKTWAALRMRQSLPGRKAGQDGI